MAPRPNLWKPTATLLADDATNCKFSHNVAINVVRLMVVFACRQTAAEVTSAVGVGDVVR